MMQVSGLNDLNCLPSGAEISIAQAIPWAIAVGGWFFVRRDQNRRQDRKELRDRIELIDQQVNEIEKLAHEYYTNSPTSDSIKIEREIKSILKKIGHQVFLIQKQHGAAFDAAGELIKFRKAVTLGSFESKSRQAISVDDALFQEINATGWDLFAKLDRAFQLPVKGRWASVVSAHRKDG